MSQAMLEALPAFELQPVLLVVAAVLVTISFRSWVRVSANIPPFPATPYPIVGHFPYLGNDVREAMLAFSKQTGGIFSMYFGGTLVIVLSSFETIKEALVKQAHFFAARPVLGLSSVLGETTGVGSSSGQAWRENRSVAISILRQLGMGKNVMAERVINEVTVYINELAKLKGKPTDVDSLTCRATSNIICSIIIGKRFEYDDASFVKFFDCFNNIVRLLGGSQLHQWYPQVKYLPGDLFEAKAHIKADQDLIGEIRGFIQSYLAEEEAGAANKEHVVALYLDQMRKKQEACEDTELSMKHLERTVSDLMLGGSSTTSVTLLWFYLYMTRHPEVQDKIYEEISEKIGRSRAITAQDNASLTYVNAAIMETQRLASIAPLGLIHRCTQDTTVGGYTIPKDTMILPHQDSVLLSDAIWGDAKTFRPERFIDGGKLIRPQENIVFSMGKRICLGESMAKMELFLFVSSVLQRFRILPEDPNCPPPTSYTMGLALSPVPFKIRFVERESD